MRRRKIRKAVAAARRSLLRKTRGKEHKTQTL